MQKLISILIIAVTALAATLTADAQTQITKVDKIQPNDQTFMDMAVSAAKTSVADNGLPCGAVMILNGAWRATGMPSNEITPEQVAINKSRTKQLANAAIYTVVQPTAKAAQAIVDAGVGAVYFVVPAADAIAAGVYSALDYEGAPEIAKCIQLPFDEATQLVKNWKK